jgi:uncharacterized protein YjiS (DUF1127 family)
MNISNRVNRLISQYHTRQELLCLPDHILKDIGKTREEIAGELNKNTLIGAIAWCLKPFRKGA